MLRKLVLVWWVPAGCVLPSCSSLAVAPSESPDAMVSGLSAAVPPVERASAIEADMLECSTSTRENAEGEEPDRLNRAAAALSRGDERGAIAELESYLLHEPQAYLFRFQLAELYHRRQEYGRAQLHYERLLADLPLLPDEPLHQYAILAHTRLCEYAVGRRDAFAEAFHRGVGLLLLACSAEKLNALLADELLGQARVALEEARQQRPSHPQLLAARCQLHLLTGHMPAARLEQAALQKLPLPRPMTVALPLE